jgi:hypothetical protein
MTETQERSREWLFHATGDLEHHVNVIENHIKVAESQVQYIIYARNTVANIPYLTGVLVCYRPQSKSYLERYCPNIWFSTPRVLRESILLIKFTENNPVEKGVSPLHPREMELELFKDDVKTGLRDLKEIRERHSSIYARFREFVLEYLDDHNPGIIDSLDIDI